jgi:MFS family permease
VSGPPEPRLVAARRALALLFVLNAVMLANVVPRMPAIKQRLGLSNTALGLALAASPLGALGSGVAAGWLVHRFGSGRLGVVCGVGFGLLLPGFAFAPSWGALAAVFFTFGALDCLMDVSLNAHALRVQRGYARSIINGLHGMWSSGALLGGVLGTGAIAAGLPLRTHLVLAGAAIAVAAIVADRWLLTGLDDADRVDIDTTTKAATRPTRSTGRRTLAILGVVLVMAAITEDAPQSWGAVFLRSELGAPAVAAGFVHLAFQIAMATTRLLGDRLVDRVGAALYVRVGGVIAALGVGAGLLIDRPVPVIIGFACAGAGTALLFPLAFDAAGRIPGLATGHGVAVVSTLARLGSMLAPPFVGLVADRMSIRAGLAIVPLAAIVVAMLAGVLRPIRTDVPSAAAVGQR